MVASCAPDRAAALTNAYQLADGWTLSSAANRSQHSRTGAGRREAASWRHARSRGKVGALPGCRRYQGVRRAGRPNTDGGHDQR